MTEMGKKTQQQQQNKKQTNKTINNDNNNKTPLFGFAKILEQVLYLSRKPKIYSKHLNRENNHSQES